MRILSRHFLRRFLSSFTATLVVLVLAVIVVELLANLDEIIESPGGLRGALAYVALRIPVEYLPYLIPVSSFAAAFLSLGTAARNLEIVALKAGGVSPLRIVLPVLALAALLSAGLLVWNETVAVEASHSWHREIQGEAVPAVTFRRGSFWYHRGRYLYNVRDADSERRSLRGVTVYELDDTGRLVRTWMADAADVEPDGTWVLQNATIRTLDPDDPEAPPRLERAERARLAAASDPNVALLEADLNRLSIRDLLEYLAAHPEPDRGTLRAETRLHQLLTEPLAVLLFALLAVPLALRVEQTKSLARPALQGLIVVFLFYTAREYGSTLALGGVAPPALPFWAILALFGGLGLFQLARVPR